MAASVFFEATISQGLVDCHQQKWLSPVKDLFALNLSSELASVPNKMSWLTIPSLNYPTGAVETTISLRTETLSRAGYHLK